MVEVLDGLRSTVGCRVPRGGLRAPHHRESHAVETQLRCGVGAALGVAVLELGTQIKPFKRGEE